MNRRWDNWLRLVGGDGAEAAGIRSRTEYFNLDTIPSDPSVPEIVWLGHASFRLRWWGQTLLFDPVFADWIGFSRRMTPKPAMALLRRPDAIVVSHGHMDHLHPSSLAALETERLIAPRKAERLLGRDLARKSDLRLVRPGDRIELGRLAITVFEAKHGGWRYPWQRGFIACSFVLSDGTRRLVWCGDTAFDARLFTSMAQGGPVDTAMLPIGAYAPQWFLQKRHMNPAEAVEAARILGARLLMPYHFGGYRLSLEPWDEPLTWFAREARAKDKEWRLALPVW